MEEKKDGIAEENTNTLSNEKLSKVIREFSTQVEGLRSSGKAILITAVGSFILMIAVALAVFFLSVQGAERVMMPDVVGKNIYTGLSELQKKELYAKINFRYSDDENEAGNIIDQNPRAGSIIKAYRRVTVTVSRGKALAVLEDYSGQNYSDVKSRFEILYAGETPLVKIAAPVYVSSHLPHGTIISQTPEEGTDVFSETTLTLIVSSGNNDNKVTVPELKEKSIPELLTIMKEVPLTFNFIQVPNTEDAFAVSNIAGNTVPEYSDVEVKISFTHRKETDEIISGLFTFSLPEYPYPVQMRLEAIDSDGNSRELIDFLHKGKLLTIPYEIKKGSTLTLFVLDEKKTSVVIN